MCPRERATVGVAEASVWPLVRDEHSLNALMHHVILASTGILNRNIYKTLGSVPTVVAVAVVVAEVAAHYSTVEKCQAAVARTR